jgi:hypothetical protein
VAAHPKFASSVHLLIGRCVALLIAGGALAPALAIRALAHVVRS